MRNLLWIMQTISWMLNLWNLSKLSWTQKKIQVFMNGFMITILFLVRSKWRWSFFASSSTFPFPFEFNLHSGVKVDIQIFLWKIDLFTLRLLRLLEPGDLVQSQCPLKTRFSSFSCKWTNKIQGSTMQLMKNLKLFELTWLLRKQPSNLWMSLVLENLLFAKNIVIG